MLARRSSLCITASLLLALAGTTSHAGTYSQSLSIPLTLTDWTQSLGLFDRFDPTLGWGGPARATLTKVEWEILSHIEATHRFENFSASSETITSTIDAYVGFSDPADAILHQAHPTDVYSDTVTADDGVFDWGGTGGRTALQTTGDASATWDSIGKPASYLTWYSAGPGTFSVSVNADGQGVSSGSGSMAYDYTCKANADAKITYTYDVIPEPATGSLMLVGLAGLAVLRRRRAS